MKCHLPEEETKANGTLQMNLYDLNKQIISQMAILSEEDLVDSKTLIRDYLREQNNYFYMLLCKELSYYTILHAVRGANELPAAADEVIACIQNVGDIKSIDRNNDNAIEIWVQREDEAVVMYLFPYDTGVVPCAL